MSGQPWHAYSCSPWHPFITINTPPDVAASMASLNKILTLPYISFVPWHFILFPLLPNTSRSASRCSSSTVQYYAVYLPWSLNQYFSPCRICQVSHGIHIHFRHGISSSESIPCRTTSAGAHGIEANILTLPDISFPPWQTVFLPIGK